MRYLPVVRCDPLTGVVFLLACVGMSAALAVMHANFIPLWRQVFLLTQALTFVAAMVLVVQWLYSGVATVRGRQRVWAMVFLLVCVLAFGSMASSAFAKHDEIYSWNLWAIEHFQRKPYDLHYTQAVYPQGYSYWLASIYLAQGQFVSQWGVRLAAGLPVLLLLGTACAAWQTPADKRALAMQVGITGCALLSAGKNLLMGYADPLMSAALVVSMAALVRYAKDPVCLGWLWASVGAAVLAAYIKQPAVLWVGGGLPLIALAGMLKWGWPRRALVLVLVGAALVGYGTFVVSAGITDNQGVISRAIGGQSLWQVFAGSSYRYLIKRPDVLLIMLGSWLAVRRIPFLHLAWWLGITPMLLLWFTLGSYESRHGTHVIWLAALLWLAALSWAKGPCTSHRAVQSALASSEVRQLWISVIGAALFVLSIPVATVAGAQIRGTDLQDGQKTAFIRQMGARDAGAFFSQLVREQSHVFVTSNYSWGLFYGRLPVMRAEDHADQGVSSLARLLAESQANYAISSGYYAYGSHSQRLLGLHERCPGALTEVMVSSDGEFKIFAIQENTLRSCLE